LKDFHAICPPFTNNEGGFVISFFAAMLVLCLAALSGCRTTSSASAEAIGCTVGDVEIVKSRYSREGITTTWCARCKLKNLSLRIESRTQPGRVPSGRSARRMRVTKKWVTLFLSAVPKQTGRAWRPVLVA
jgi:hypothetical protein